MVTPKDLMNFFKLVEADDELEIVVIDKNSCCPKCHRYLINHPKSELLLDIIEDLTE